MDVYAIERSQEQCTVIGGDPEVYEERCIGTFFYVYLSTNVNTMFGSPANLMDLNKAPNLADVPPGYLGFTYMSFDRIDGCSKEVDQAPVCEVAAYARERALGGHVDVGRVSGGRAYDKGSLQERRLESVRLQESGPVRQLRQSPAMK